MSPYLGSQFSTMRWARKLLFGGLVVLLYICKPRIISFLAHWMSEIWPLKVRYIFLVKIWHFSAFCPPYLGSQFSTMRWARKLLFGGLVVLLHICKPQIISLGAHCMFKIWSLKVRYISTKSIICNSKVPVKSLSGKRTWRRTKRLQVKLNGVPACSASVASKKRTKAIAFTRMLFLKSLKHKHKFEFFWNFNQKRWFFPKKNFVIEKFEFMKIFDSPKCNGNCLGQSLTTFWAHILHVHTFLPITNLATNEIQEKRPFSPQ